MKINLVFKEKDLDIIATHKVPPIVYTLSGGLSRKDITLPVRVGPWKFMWVNTQGRHDQGDLMLLPNNINAKRLLHNARVKHYKTHNFNPIEAEMLASTDVPSYWCPKNLQVLRDLSSGTLVYQTLETLRVDLQELSDRYTITPSEIINQYVLLQSLLGDLTS